jgi:hypothetical protein
MVRILALYSKADISTSVGFPLRLLPLKRKKPSHPAFHGNPVSFSFPRQPGHLIETRGFPSPPHEGFGFVEGYFLKTIIIYLVVYQKNEFKSILLGEFLKINGSFLWFLFRLSFYVKLQMR